MYIWYRKDRGLNTLLVQLSGKSEIGLCSKLWYILVFQN